MFFFPRYVKTYKKSRQDLTRRLFRLYNETVFDCQVGILDFTMKLFDCQVGSLDFTRKLYLIVRWVV